MSKNEFFLKYLQDLSITNLTEIQSLCFQPLYDDKSVFALAPTGSGKTLAFALPLALRVNYEKRNTQKLILVPTRELGNQIARVFQKVSAAILARDGKNILICTAFGGSPIAAQKEELAKKPHILIATPGRVIDLLERKAFDFSKIDTLILDEADIMVGMGFAEQVEEIYNIIPTELKIGFFSATKTEKVSDLEKKIFQKTKYIICDTNESADINSKKIHDSQIYHKYIYSSYDNKFANLVSFLKGSATPTHSGKVLLFCHQRETAHQLADSLKAEGLSVAALTGELGQIHRDSIMRNFKTGNLKYLVATNIAARGIDINQLSAVIHYDVSPNEEEYIHRSGRTGRSGYSEGSSITFCDPKTKGHYLKLMESLELSTEEIKLHKDKPLAFESSAPLKKKITNDKIMFFKIHLNKGKKHNIRPGDILGAFIKDLGLKKDDIGSIFIFDNFTHIEINADKKNTVLNRDFKVKNLVVKTSISGNSKN